ncbi:MAG: restriction endonuclease subunit S, partial [Bacteroidetes bacterium]|nr:restriction endonuclease subunit S [Bacteroidota bacterium]
MTNWKEYKLSDLMDVIGGGTPKTKIPEYWDGN